MTGGALASCVEGRSTLCCVCYLRHVGPVPLFTEYFHCPVHFSDHWKDQSKFSKQAIKLIPYNLLRICALEPKLPENTDLALHQQCTCWCLHMANCQPMFNEWREAEGQQEKEGQDDLHKELNDTKSCSKTFPETWISVLAPIRRLVSGNVVRLIQSLVVFMFA